MTEKEQKAIIKAALKNEVSPLLMGLRNELKEVVKEIKAFAKESGTVQHVEKEFILTPYTPIKGKDYFTDIETSEFKEAIRPIRGTDYFTAKDIKDFIKQVTPRKGIDYRDGTDGKNGKTPVKGKDYFTDTEVNKFLKAITPVKGVHYKDGTDGAKGKDGTAISAEDIRNKLESLKGTARLSMNAIKGLKEAIANAGGGGAPIGASNESSTLTPTGVVAGNYTNANITVNADGRISAAANGSSSGVTWGTIAGTLSAQTDLQAALDAKVTANSNITGATKTKITYDAKGLVTAGADATTSDIAEGSNLYYTAARFNTAFATKSTTDLAEGTNLYYTAARFNTAFAAKTTADLTENTNLYYTDARVRANRLDQMTAPTASVSMNSQQLTNLLDPTSAQDAATKNYVDNFITGITWKTAVACATTANITLSGEQTIDGVLTSASRVLVKNQSTASENGIYISDAGAWTRSTDANTGAELVSATMLVSGGTVNADTQWTCTNNSITLGSTSITFAQIAGSGTYTNGTGLTLTGNIFAIDSTVTTLTGTQTLSGKTLTTPKIASLYQDSIGGSNLITMPAATDTLMGKATTDIMTNKTYDTAGTGNTFKINGTTISDKTGTGKAVLDTTPTLVTPVLGVATATSINKVAITAPATSATLTIADGKTLTVSNTLTFVGTDGQTFTFPNGSDTVVTLSGTQLLKNKAIGDQPINAQSGTTYTFVLGDAGYLVTGSNASATTFTVPPNSSVAFPLGSRIDVTQVGAGKLTLAQGSGVTINSQAGNKACAAQYVGVSLVKTATDTWLLLGNLIA